MRFRHYIILVSFLACTPALRADWDPDAGQWGKSAVSDLRVMTWNVDDGICSLAAKQEADGDSWSALAHIVAAMKPDVLFMQEAGDNDGYGAGGAGDSVADLNTAVDLFLHGGVDPFLPDHPEVTAFVQAYDPDYDLPYVHVSECTDGYNRNVILSRFPFVDLNGDGICCYSDIPEITAEEYATGGTGGIRGFQFAEIDLPDEVYCGDLVVGQGHLKAGGYASDLAARVSSARNIAYFIDYWYNGAGTGVPDPHDCIADSPPAASILEAFTPVVIGGDWNEDELYNDRRGPADWMTQAAEEGGSDGTDRDRSDMVYDEAVEYFSGLRRTYYYGSDKYDYLGWQDSVVALRRAFIYYSVCVPEVSQQPAEVRSYATPSAASWDASKHRPVIADLLLPTLAGHDCGPCAGQMIGDANGDGALNGFDIDAFVIALTDPAGYAALYGESALLCRCDVHSDGSVNGFDIDPFVALLAGR
jgi:hypothetical protein